MNETKLSKGKVTDNLMFLIDRVRQNASSIRTFSNLLEALHSYSSKQHILDMWRIFEL